MHKNEAENSSSGIRSAPREFLRSKTNQGKTRGAKKPQRPLRFKIFQKIDRGIPLAMPVIVASATLNVHQGSGQGGTRTVVSGPRHHRNFFQASTLQAAQCRVENLLILPAFFAGNGERGFSANGCREHVDLPCVRVLIRDRFTFYDHAIALEVHLDRSIDG